MSQYRKGTVQVTNGSAAVVGTGTAFVANVAQGQIFTVAGSGVAYQVASVTDDTHLTLASNYGAPSGSGLAYSITTSITPILQLPYMEDRDIDTATIFKKAMLMIESIMNRRGRKGADVASASNMSLGFDGDYFHITGATQINLIDSTGWDGQLVTLKFNGAPTVKNNQAASGAFKPVRLNGSVDFVASALDTLSIRYDSADGCWYESGRAVI